MKGSTNQIWEKSIRNPVKMEMEIKGMPRGNMEYEHVAYVTNELSKSGLQLIVRNVRMLIIENDVETGLLRRHLLGMLRFNYKKHLEAHDENIKHVDTDFETVREASYHEVRHG